MSKFKVLVLIIILKKKKFKIIYYGGQMVQLTVKGTI